MNSQAGCHKSTASWVFRTVCIAIRCLRKSRTSAEYRRRFVSNVTIALVEFIAGWIRSAVRKRASFKMVNKALQRRLAVLFHCPVNRLNGDAHALFLYELEGIERPQHTVRIDGLENFGHA